MTFTIPIFRGEQRCLAKEDNGRLRAEPPRPPWNDQSEDSLAQSRQKLRGWVGRNFRAYPVCPHGGEVQLAFSWDITEKDGKYMYPLFQCTRCDS